jgi:tetratricopeptide (TPR) repeat protein
MEWPYPVTTETMKRDTAPRRANPPKRHWHIPPPLIHGPDPLEGGLVLQEFPGEVGVVLWQALRDVMLWSQTPPSSRGEIFADTARERRIAAILAAGPGPELEVQLRALTDLTSSPATIRAELITVTCRAISQWAEAKGKLGTAMAFGQNAALASPGDAVAALNVGRLARKITDYARAEIWFRRAIGLARQARDWRTYTIAFIGLGNMAVRRGNYPAGRRFRIRALRSARRGGLRRLQAVVLHDLFALEVECGNTAAAESYARRAFQHYRGRGDRLPALANDLANLWLANGSSQRALRVLVPLARLQLPEDDRLFVLASLARAAGGSSEAEKFDDAAAEVSRLVASGTHRGREARALLDVAYGAAALARWDVAQDLASIAGSIASERRESKTEFLAESLLYSVSSKRSLLVTTAESVESAACSDSLADDVATSLLTETAAA